jgi:hypothetical protein
MIGGVEVQGFGFWVSGSQYLNNVDGFLICDLHAAFYRFFTTEGTEGTEKNWVMATENIVLILQAVYQ